MLYSLLASYTSLINQNLLLHLLIHPYERLLLSSKLNAPNSFFLKLSSLVLHHTPSSSPLLELQIMFDLPWRKPHLTYCSENSCYGIIIFSLTLSPLLPCCLLSSRTTCLDIGLNTTIFVTDIGTLILWLLVLLPGI